MKKEMMVDKGMMIINDLIVIATHDEKLKQTGMFLPAATIGSSLQMALLALSSALPKTGATRWTASGPDVSSML